MMAYTRPGTVIVALLTEGVDRNQLGVILDTGLDVALLTEGVDRNLEVVATAVRYFESPSSRRAWIEIFPGPAPRRQRWRSPSSRRAWIEIG